jgi:hypothetical protein
VTQPWPSERPASRAGSQPGPRPGRRPGLGGRPGQPQTVTVTYGQPAVEAPEAGFKAPRYWGIGQALDRINRFEHQHGRPMLSAPVVHAAGTRHPAPGTRHRILPCARALAYDVPPGREREFWAAQLREVIAYWSSR